MDYTRYVLGILIVAIPVATVVSALTDHPHPEHVPQQDYQTSPIRTITANHGTASGASGTLGSIFQN